MSSRPKRIKSKVKNVFDNSTSDKSTDERQASNVDPKKRTTRQFTYRRGKGGSVVWFFFSFPAGEKRYTVCNLCNHCTTWDPVSNSTSNMLKHIRSKHFDIMEQVKHQALDQESSRGLLNHSLQMPNYQLQSFQDCISNLGNLGEMLFMSD